MQIKRASVLLLIFLLFQSAFAQPDKEYKLFEHDIYTFPYEMNNPDERWKLPSKLVEISGLSYIDENRLACVQDEKGNIYIYHLKEDEVEYKIDFGSSGDYEGIELVGADAWI